MNPRYGYSALFISGFLLIGATACGTSADATPATSSSSADSTTSELEKMTPPDVAMAIEGFFDATTSDEVGAAFPDHADEKTFSAAVQFTDPDAQVRQVAEVMADFALLKVMDTDANLTITIDESQIVIGDDSASLPAKAITIKSGDKILDSSDTLAESINDLVFQDGDWLIGFPDTQGVVTTPPAAGS